MDRIAVLFPQNHHFHHATRIGSPLLMHHTLLAVLLLAVPHAAGLATPVLETVAVRGAASRSLRVAEGQADTIDSGA